MYPAHHLIPGLDIELGWDELIRGWQFESGPWRHILPLL